MFHGFALIIQKEAQYTGCSSDRRESIAEDLSIFGHLYPSSFECDQSERVRT